MVTEHTLVVTEHTLCIMEHILLGKLAYSIWAWSKLYVGMEHTPCVTEHTLFITEHILCGRGSKISTQIPSCILCIMDPGLGA